MDKTTLENQRTYLLAGSSGTGKTSLAEMILYQSGQVKRLGSIESGNTQLDFEPEETKKGGSVQSALTTYTWNKNRHFLLDTPGDTNFLGEFPYQLLAVESAIYVLDAADGIKPQDKKQFGDIRKTGKPILAVVNKLDRETANFEQVVTDLKENLNAKPAVVYVPIGSEGHFEGFVDVLENKAYFFQDDGKVKPGEISGDLGETVNRYYEEAIENIAENDEELMEKYLEEGELSYDEARKGLHTGILNGEVVPVCPAAALSNKGGSQVLNLVHEFMPSPLERDPWQGTDGSTRESSPDAPTACFVFKTLTTPFGGQLNILRVLSGVISSDMTLFNPARDAREKLGQLQWVVGKSQEPCKEEVGPGGIVAVAKLKNTNTGDTLCSEKEPFELDKPELHQPLLSFALQAATRDDEDKMMVALNKLLEEDVSLKLAHNDETREILLSGMGQLHIETALEKVKRRNKVEVELNEPKIPFKETLKGEADVSNRFKKQSGGRGQFGECSIRVAPKARGEGYEFVNQIVGGVIPKTYIPAVDQGIQEAAEKGPLAGYPVIDFQVVLYDGSYHSVDSSEMAFKVTGSQAFKKAADKAGVTLLEPIMKLNISVPDDYMGDIIGDISSRRGKVLGYETSQGITQIGAQVPMAEVLKYAPDLRAMTGGQGTFTMEFDHYEEAPAHIQEKVIEAANKKAEEEHS
ncbi:MAG: elongation factor G [Thermodesulfobacteriota bacterium]